MDRMDRIDMGDMGGRGHRIAFVSVHDARLEYSIVILSSTVFNHLFDGNLRFPTVIIGGYGLLYSD